MPDNIILSIANTDVIIYFENLEEEEQEVTIDQYKLIAIGADKLKSSYKVKSL